MLKLNNLLLVFATHLLRVAKLLELEGKPVGWAIRLLRSIVHGEALQDPEADAA